MTKTENERLDQDTILTGAAKLWPDLAEPIWLKYSPIQRVTGVNVYLLIAGHNRIGLAWIDPDDCLPVYKPSGSTVERKKGHTF